MNSLQLKINSPIGPLYLVASNKGLSGIYLKKQPISMAKITKKLSFEDKVLKQAETQINAYFSGKLKSFKVPLDPKGSPFQMKVWNELKKIPYGKTYSYKDIAKKLSKPKAYRAVGNANGKNPLCIIIPCHRVIAANGTLGGYSGGLSIKKNLLRLEQKYYSVSWQ